MEAAAIAKGWWGALINTAHSRFWLPEHLGQSHRFCQARVLYSHQVVKLRPGWVAIEVEIPGPPYQRTTTLVISEELFLQRQPTLPTFFQNSGYSPVCIKAWLAR